MTYTAKIKLQYDSNWEYTYGSSWSESNLLPEEHITFECPVHDLNTIQFFKLFRNFLMAIGHNEEGISRGASSLVFGEDVPERIHRQMAEYCEVTLNEDVTKKVQEEVEKSRAFDDDWNRAQEWEKKYYIIKEKYDELINSPLVQGNLDKMVDSDSFLTKDRDSNFPGENSIAQN